MTLQFGLSGIGSSNKRVFGSSLTGAPYSDNLGMPTKWAMTLEPPTARHRYPIWAIGIAGPTARHWLIARIP